MRYDRRMSVLNNLRFGLLFPGICAIRGHRWAGWWGVLDDDGIFRGDEFRVCLRCVAHEERDT